MIVDDGVFRVESELDGWNERLMVFCDDPQAAAQALVRAAPRLQRVLWDGREVSEQEWQASGLELAAAANSGSLRLAHPSDLTQACEYVSDPLLHADGASIYMDTNSELGKAAAAAFFAIIRDELLAEGVDSARLAEHEI
jgi:hypothetical protein